MAIVLDASVMLRWYFQDEDDVSGDLMRSLAEERIVVPSHWQGEVANGILIGERRGRAPADQVARLLYVIEPWEIEVDDEGAHGAIERVLPLARAHRLTVYDAFYLELAERRGLPLATYDAPLARAASSVGVDVLGAGGSI